VPSEGRPPGEGRGPRRDKWSEENFGRTVAQVEKVIAELHNKVGALLREMDARLWLQIRTCNRRRIGDYEVSQRSRRQTGKQFDVKRRNEC